MTGIAGYPMGRPRGAGDWVGGVGEKHDQPLRGVADPQPLLLLRPLPGVTVSQSLLLLLSLGTPAK